VTYVASEGVQNKFLLASDIGMEEYGNWLRSWQYPSF